MLVLWKLKLIIDKMYVCCCIFLTFFFIILMEDSLKKKMVPLSEISSSKAYKNLLKTQIKFSELTSVSEHLPMVRVGS